jgi:peptidoglycan/xylan/chitin deacetylase (PgdA/CDA1 family)
MNSDLCLRTIVLCALVSGSACFSVACHSKSSSASDRSCTAVGQALTAEPLRGGGLPPKTLAFTFDDGPGDRTEELSQYLKDQKIRVGFFINGKNLTHGTGVLKELVDAGHVIGNHTQTHPDLTTLTSAQVVAELTETDALIAPFVPDNRFMFRPPFGAYDDVTFQALQGSPMNKYIGPIDWDIGDRMGPEQAADWDCWAPNGTSIPPVLDVKTCGDLYLAEIRHVSSGIVLMHDPYFIDDDPMKGGTVDMVKYIVPILKAEGFTFVRLDEVPAISAVLPPLTTRQSTQETDPTQPSAARDPNTAAPSGGTTDPCAGLPQH